MASDHLWEFTIVANYLPTNFPKLSTNMFYFFLSDKVHDICILQWTNTETQDKLSMAILEKDIKRDSSLIQIKYASTIYIIRKTGENYNLL